VVLHQPDVGAAPIVTRTGAGSVVTPVALLAGLDLLTERERHADALALVLAAGLVEAGGQAVTVGTHAARLGDLGHVALVVEVAGLDADAVARLVRSAADQQGVPTPGPPQRGLLVGPDFTGSAALLPVLRDAVEAQRRRSSGRAVVFPGSAGLTGTTTVAAVVAGSSIDRVQVIGAAAVDPVTPLVTRDFVRPLWVGGELVLHTQPAVGGVLVPFETPDPTPCCAAHA